MLKGSGIEVKEDLRDNRLKLMQAAIEKTSLKRVWSYNVTIYVTKDNRRIYIKNKDDLMMIYELKWFSHRGLTASHVAFVTTIRRFLLSTDETKYGKM
nr:unnamed protein product [Callosobruchus analis]